MWFEAHRLLRSVQSFSAFENDEAIESLLVELEKFKSRMQSICRNSGKSTKDRETLKPNTEIKVDGSSVLLDDALCNETKIISDTFNMNELDALQIVLSGESQVSNFAGLNRGLVAVVCYYDMHRYFVETLKTVLLWGKDDVSEKLAQFIQRNFVTSSVFRHLLQLQGTFSVSSEFTLLSQPGVNGLGGTKHQQLIRALVEEISESSASCLHSICAWGVDNAKEFASDLYPILKAVPVGEKFSAVHLAAWSALIRLTSSTVLSQANTVSSVLSEMLSQIRNETAWSDQSVCGTIQLACAIAIRAMAVSPADHLNVTNVEVDVDRIVDRAVQNMALKFIRFGIIGSDSFKMYSPYAQVVDTLLKQLILYFPAKLMEVERNSEDELQWIDEMAQKNTVPQGHPNLHYVSFLGCISDLYFLIDGQKTSDNMKAELTALSVGYSNQGSVELCRFMERGRNSCHAVHAVAYLEFLRAVCRSQATATFLFEVFARVPAHHDNFVGWEQVMIALRSYERLFREQKTFVPHFGSQGSTPAAPPNISAEELAGMIAWINLARTIAELDSEAAATFVEERHWALVDAAMGVISAPVPLALKGSLFKLLSAAAKGEMAVAKIWHSMNAYQICSFSENGALLGLQQEMEERECTANQFDVSLGFAHLMNSLLKNSDVPDFSAPYIQYLTKSIISQMASRSYKDVSQMWELAEVSLDALLSILKRSYTDSYAVVKKDAHVQLLVQILNDTPLYLAICTVLLEDCDSYHTATSSGPRISGNAALAALRLLSLAVSRHCQLRAAVRAANSDIMLSSLQVLLLSPLRNLGVNVMDIAFNYVEQVDVLPCHALPAVNILRDLCSVRPSLQGKMVELIRMRVRSSGGDWSHMRAVRVALNHLQVSHTVHDIIHSDLDISDHVRCRGEVARRVLELLSDVVQSDPAGPNICYLLFGFLPATSDRLFTDVSLQTGFHEVLKILEQFDSPDPLELPFSALFEPAFRLMHRLVSLDCVYSSSVLRHLRSSDIIKRLVSSTAMRAVSENERYTIEDGDTVFSLSRMISGSILHLAALEISSLIKNGHFERPSDLYRVLLEANGSAETSTAEPTNLLFSILHNGNTVFAADADFPHLAHFNVHKLTSLFNDCKSSTVLGISQYDIESLHCLLNREIDSTKTDDAIFVEREMKTVLEYCTDLNSQLLQRGAANTLVSGCTALLNVIAISAPVPFFSIECQLDVLSDAAYALIEFASSCCGDSLPSISATLLRLTKAICTLSKQHFQELPELRDAVSRLLTPLIELLVMPGPGDSSLQSKVSLYEGARLCLRTCYDVKQPETSSTPSATEWLLDGVVSHASSDPIRTVIDRFAYDLSRKVSMDIDYLPVNLKISCLLFLSDLLHEDVKGSKKFVSIFAKTGMPRYMTELLARIEVDWKRVAQRDTNAVQEHTLLITLLLVLTRLSLSVPGWTSLAELAVPEVLCQLAAFADPPKQIFLQPASVNQKDSASYLYVSTVDLVIHLCLSMCAQPKWKRLSLKILDVIHRHIELLGQLMRAEIKCSIVDQASKLVQHIWQDDTSTRFAIDGDSVLRLLRERSAEAKAEQRKPLVEKPSFNAPTRLLKGLFA